VFKALPLIVSLLLKQPVIVGVASLMILSALLPGRSRAGASPLPSPRRN
jgi:hypothetical protein